MSHSDLDALRAEADLLAAEISGLRELLKWKWLYQHFTAENEKLKQQIKNMAATIAEVQQTLKAKAEAALAPTPPVPQP